MADDSLAKKERLAGDIGIRYSRLVEQSVDMMELCGRAAEILDEEGKEREVPPAKFTTAELNILRHALRPSKDVPFYMRCAKDRTDLALRIAGDRANAPQQIARYVVTVAEPEKPREYPVLDVTPGEDR